MDVLASGLESAPPKRYKTIYNGIKQKSRSALLP